MEQSKDEEDERVDERRDRATVGVGTRSFFLEPGGVMGVEGRTETTGLSVEETRVFEEVGVTSLVVAVGESLCGVRVRDLWPGDRGVTAFSLSLDFGVPADFRGCNGDGLQ